MSSFPQLRDEYFGPIRVSGDVDGYHWEFRASIEDDGVRKYVSFRSSTGLGSGGGGAGGALPFAQLGDRQLGHIGSMGWTGDATGRHKKQRQPRAVHGVVSLDVAKVLVALSDGRSCSAQLVDVGHPGAKLFVRVFPAPVSWLSVVAVDAAGREIERRDKAELSLLLSASRIRRITRRWSRPIRAITWRR